VRTSDLTYIHRGLQRRSGEGRAASRASLLPGSRAVSAPRRAGERALRRPADRSPLFGGDLGTESAETDERRARASGSRSTRRSAISSTTTRPGRSPRRTTPACATSFAAAPRPASPGARSRRRTEARSALPRLRRRCRSRRPLAPLWPGASPPAEGGREVSEALILARA
jgi:hypothetical protein